MGEEEKRAGRKEEEKELIEKICTYAKGLIECGEYADKPQQLIDFAKKELGAYLTVIELDRLVRKHMRLPEGTQKELNTKYLFYRNLQDYIDRTRAEVRLEQHGETEGGKIPLSDLLSFDKRSRTYQRRK
ncbi:hypothetical protein KY317_00435 [Candidatus Woesearchaeota archaeon]|nr:hypothetical protein [Candidatus Woesearchaeota archaeon]